MGPAVPLFALRGAIGRPVEQITLNLPVTPPILMRLHHDEELISRVLRRHGLWEAASSWFCLHYVRQGDIAVDVGANIGYYTLLLSTLVGVDGLVHAFEPEPGNLALLHENLRINGCTNVVVYPAALADRQDQCPLYLCPTNRGDHRLGFLPDRDMISVAVTTADLILTMLPNRTSLFKIDVQGAEEHVLRGMRGLIEQNRQDLTILMELCPGQLPSMGSTYDSLLAYLEEMDARFLLFDHWSSHMVSLRETDMAAVRHLAKAMLCDSVDTSLNVVLTFGARGLERIHERLGAA